MGVPEHETEAPAEARTGGDGKPKRIILRQFIAFLMFVLVVVPLLVIAVSIIFGFILAEGTVSFTATSATLRAARGLWLESRPVTTTIVASRRERARRTIRAISEPRD
jgi:nitrate reductase NapE component